jgi:hypothetical protein
VNGAIDIRSAAGLRQNQLTAEHVNHVAIGGRAGQDVKDRVHGGEDPSIAFDRLLELADKFGLNSATVAAFMRELGKAFR